MAKATKPPSEADLLLAVYNSLLRFWMKQGNSKEKAEDLAQAGIVKCLLNIDHFKGKSSLKTYLTVVGKSGGYDLLRKDARYEKLKRLASEVVSALEPVSKN